MKRFQWFFVGTAIFFLSPLAYAQIPPPVVEVQIVGTDQRRTIPPGSQRVEMLRLTLIASCMSEVDVETIYLRRTGLGDRSDIDRVYATSNGQRINRGRQVQRDGSVDLSLRQFRLEPCASRSIEILADFNEDAAVTGEHGFRFLGLDTVQEVEVRFAGMPGSLPTVQTGGGRSQGTITVDYLRLLKPVRYGTRRQLSRFRLMGDDEERQAVSSITLTNDGSAQDDDLQNLYLHGRGQRLTEIVPSMTGDRVTLQFLTPYIIDRNRRYVFTLVGDIRVGRRKTIRFIIEEPSDILATTQRGRR